MRTASRMDTASLCEIGPLRQSENCPTLSVPEGG